MIAPTPLLILGAGGFARGVHDVVDAINAHSLRWHVLGYLDDAPDAASISRAQRRATPILGTLSDATNFPRDTHVVVGITRPDLRRILDENLSKHGLPFATLIHPTVTTGYGAAIGEGSVLCAGVRLASNVTLGRHTHVNLNCSFGHDAVTEEYVSLFPQAALSGFARACIGATLGSQSVVLPSLSVGKFATVGAGAVVDRNVADGATVKGVPAR